MVSPASVILPAPVVAPGTFSSACGGGGSHRAARPAASGHGHGAAAGSGNRSAPMVIESYEDPDIPNILPQFRPSCPPGVHFECPLLRGTMTKAVEFSHLFFTTEMINDICKHTNSYANERIIEGSHSSYLKADGSWKDITCDEINRLITLLLYVSLVKVGTNVDKYWSTKSLLNGLWARSIMSRLRFKAIMAFPHVVDPAAETPGDKSHKVDSFVNYFKSRCADLYQPRQQVAIDERLVKSRHRSGIRQYIKDKPTKWGIKLWVLADSSNGYTMCT